MKNKVAVVVAMVAISTGSVFAKAADEQRWMNRGREIRDAVTTCAQDAKQGFRSGQATGDGICENAGSKTRNVIDNANGFRKGLFGR